MINIHNSVEITNKMQPCNRIYYSTTHSRLNMFWAAYRSSSGALTVYAASGLHTHVVTGRSQVWVRLDYGWSPHAYVNQRCKYSWSSWWWGVCRSKHVEPSMNGGIINSIARLHLVGYFYWVILRCTDPWILNLKEFTNCTLHSTKEKSKWKSVMYVYVCVCVDIYNWFSWPVLFCGVQCKQYEHFL